jgi:hypothetical protein
MKFPTEWKKSSKPPTMYIYNMVIGGDLKNYIIMHHIDSTWSESFKNNANNEPMI